MLGLLFGLTLPYAYSVKMGQLNYGLAQRPVKNYLGHVFHMDVHFTGVNIFIFFWHLELK